jgi:hypothetical protein
MKSILDTGTRDEIIRRIQALTENSPRGWGKMNVSQMIRHCRQWDEMALGKKKYKQSLLGRIFGRVALKNFLKDEPVRKNLPTVSDFKIRGEANVAEEKEKWIQEMRKYQNISPEGFMHPFFGYLNKEQTGRMVYKHADHHLRQFGC